MSGVVLDSSCCKTGATLRRAKMSPGRRRTGRWLIVAKAAPVTMLVAPGPMELVQATMLLRKGDCGVHHRLLVAEQGILEIRILLESLPHTGDVPVSEDPKAARKKAF